MKIDLFCHILPPAYFERMIAISARGAYMQKRIREIPVMIDLELDTQGEAEAMLASLLELWGPISGVLIHGPTGRIFDVVEATDL